MVLSKDLLRKKNDTMDLGSAVIPECYLWSRDTHNMACYKQMSDQITTYSQAVLEKS